MNRRVEEMFSTLKIPIPKVKPVKFPGKQDKQDTQATVDLNLVAHKSADIVFSSREDIPIQNLKEKDNAENYAQLAFKESSNLNSMAAPHESVEKMCSFREEDVLDQKIKSHPKHSTQPVLKETVNLHSMAAPHESVEKMCSSREEDVLQKKIKSHPQHSAQPVLKKTENLNSTTVAYKSPSSSSSSSSSCSSRSSSPASQFDDSHAYPIYNIDNEGVTKESTDEYDSNDDQNEIKKKSRKRKRNTDNWKRNIVKKLRNSGKEYRPLNSKRNNEILVAARKLLPPCQDKCRLNCSSKFTEEERQSLFNKFWDLGDLERQRYYVLIQMQSVQPKYKRIVLDRKKSSEALAGMTRGEA